MSRRAPVGVVVLAALAAAAALHLAGSSALAAPPLGSWRELDAWYARTGPATAVVALVRAAAFGAAVWLVLVGVLQLLAAGTASARLSWLVDGVSPRFLRALSTGAAGMSVSAALALPALPSGASENPPGTAVMVPLDAAAPSSSTTTMAAAPTTSPTAPTTTVPPTPPTTPGSTPGPPVAATPAPRPEEVVVERGDSFWSIAVEEAGERDLVRYWRALIEANRDRLVDPSNPDLLHPGQVLRLP